MDGRPTIGQLKHYTTISPTTAQPLSNPAPTIGNLNPSATVLRVESKNDFAKVAKKEVRGMPTQISLRHLVKSCGFPSKITTVKGVYPRNFQDAVRLYSDIAADI